MLDGVVVARVERPPWRAEVPFGNDLQPHELTAISYDAQGAELARAHQWINLPRPAAEGRVLLEGGEDGRGVVARLIWESVASETPSSLRVVFDGLELEVEDPRRFVLPDHDPERLHYLRAELEFAGSIASVIELTFGGSFTGRAESRQMAIPIQVDSGGKLGSTDVLQGRFAKDGESIRVLAVDEGPAEVVLVRDKGVQPLLDRLARHERSRTPAGPSFRYAAGLKKGQRVRFLSPFARLDRRAGYNYELFPPSGELSPHDGGVFWHLLTVRPSATPLNRQRIVWLEGIHLPQKLTVTAGLPAVELAN